MIESALIGFGIGLILGCIIIMVILALVSLARRLLGKATFFELMTTMIGIGLVFVLVGWLV